ncbi:MAG: DUF4277 domain-containing protein [Dolichospermum sp.]|nr:DUF4277 domain-containing protein [Dolichospermum sp.]
MGVEAEHLNDSRLGRVLDQLYWRTTGSIYNGRFEA